MSTRRGANGGCLGSIFQHLAGIALVLGKFGETALLAQGRFRNDFIKFNLRAETQCYRIAWGNIADIPMRPVANALNGRLCGADKS